MEALNELIKGTNAPLTPIVLNWMSYIKKKKKLTTNDLLRRGDVLCETEK